MRQPKPTLGDIAALEADIAQRDKRIADLEATISVLLGAVRSLDQERSAEVKAAFKAIVQELINDLHIVQEGG